MDSDKNTNETISQLKHETSWDEFLRDSPIDVRDHPSLIHMLKYHVDKTPDKVIMMWPSNNFRSFEYLTAKEIWEIGSRYYNKFVKEVIPDVPPRSWIGVLLEDNGHIWWTIVALLRADMNALMINYKQSAASILNLMEKTGAKVLLTTKRLARTTLRDMDESSGLRIVVQQREDLEVVRKWETTDEELRAPRPNELDETRFCLHSSGSTGLPSPIYLPNSRLISDCLLMYVTHINTNAETNWTTRTLVLSPSAHMLGFTYSIGATMILGFTSVLALSPRFPPSVPEILRTIELAEARRLVTVPAILEMIVTSLPDSSPQWRVMQQLETISFGGAQLPAYLGKKLMSKGIDVVYGYGSTESGINMVGRPSDQDPTSLRMLPFASWKFIPQDGDENTATVFELVILKNSFSLAPGVANCDEGFATSDLFRRGKKPGEWHHVGRKGDTLVHVNGEKTNASLMEDTIMTSSQGRIRRANVLGSGRNSTALLVEFDWDRMPPNLTEDELIDIAYESARAANKISPKHSKIMKDKIKVLSRDQHIPTSDKGNVQRFKVLKMFEKEIETLYNPPHKEDGDVEHRHSQKRHKTLELKQAVSETLAAALDVNPEDVFNTDEPLPTPVKQRITTELENVVGSPLGVDVITEHSTANDILEFLVQHYASDAAQMSLEGANPLGLDLPNMVAEALEIDVSELQARKTDSLLDMGLSSLEANAVQRAIEEKLQIELPPNFVYDHATLVDLERGLQEFFPGVSRSSSVRPTLPRDDDPFHYKETGNLQRKYCDFIAALSIMCRQDIRAGKMGALGQKERVVLITGASGHLGVHMVKAALESPVFRKVVCLLRGKDVKQRMKESFESRFLDKALLDSPKAVFFNYDSRDPMMGIPEEEYVSLQNEVTDIVHNAWKVNFNIRVRDYESDWLRSTWYMILFACGGTKRKSVNFISSVSAVSNYQGEDSIPEEYFGDEQLYMTQPIGYAQSKFIGESMLAQARESLGLTCRVFRCGQICGDTEHGVWKQEEMLPLVTVKGGGELHMIPENMDYSGLIPVDIAGGSIIEIISKDHNRLMYHMTNPNGGTWVDWMDALQEAGLPFERVDGYKFLKVLKANPENECNLLYGVLEAQLSAPRSSWKPPLGCTETEKASEVLRRCPRINSELAEKFLKYWKSTGFLKADLGA
eukprot:Gregarina_sp_Pseudo_9__2761@NODE_2_length_7458_cov_33_430786_g1_i0_p1_GENE_NODE_2_length_7458_cov_33_430786_g1_i0NODE_2_length_7458_cov_33_430786_g1_i0_p1_ORF_typecomplete_len1170_score405_23NAD_binding_4/PF07993_12/1_4e44AMPbinding/PF00501_28/2_7e37Epimerase/PF01370_21/9_4e12PPbinding/PF00550_25/7_1e03PPbinding/PF00550_25/7_9e02PPbinding/PF00550_25/4_4e073Beta_HSD/PF01073_19/2_1e05RmlD_sub_bind/PF04321_17/7_2RmlD_sub_bind/PF04321_17/0_12GDP_Man_Dehyd/PF16363_5/0_0011NmrA/PF05368_13/0_16DapB_N/P